jgi:hypothetical protein
MNVITRFALAVFAMMFVCTTTSAQDSLVRIRWASPSEFEKLLPQLPTDIPWLLAAGRTQAKKPSGLPDAGSLRALLWQPKPARPWPASLTSQSVTASALVGG